MPRFSGCRDIAGDPSDRKYSRWENGRHRNHESSARARRRRRGLVSNVESYRYLSRRNPRSSQCLPVKWVNKSSGVIHLSRSAAAEGIVATRRIQGSRSTDPERERKRARRKRPPRAPSRDLNSSDGFISMHWPARTWSGVETLFLSSVLLFPRSGDARDKAAARRIGRGPEESLVDMGSG